MSLIEQVKIAAAERRKAAAEEYLAILGRDQAQPGDAARVSELFGILGRSADDLSGDVELVAELGRLRDRVAELSDSESAIKEAREGLREAQAWAAAEQVKLAARVAERIQPAEKALAAARSRVIQAAQVASQLQDAVRRWQAIVEGCMVTELQSNPAPGSAPPRLIEASGIPAAGRQPRAARSA